MKQRKVRADFDKSQPIAVNVSGCTEGIKKQVQQAFFDTGLSWNVNFSDDDGYGLLGVDFYTNTYSDGEVSPFLLWVFERSLFEPSSAITPDQFFATVYEDKPQGHPHAELMAQFAEDAKTHPRPWELWQSKHMRFTEWSDCEAPPRWIESTQYRRKPKTHKVNGVEIPDLRIKGVPKYGTPYYLVDPMHDDLHGELKFEGGTMDHLWLQCGLIYEHTEAGKQAAILHAKTMLGIA